MRRGELFDYELEGEAAARAAAERLALYLDDLREVLGSPAGLRVLRRWLDCAWTFSLTFGGNEREGLRLAALSDYGKERFYEIAEAAPEACAQVMLEGLRQNLSPKEKKHAG